MSTTRKAIAGITLLLLALAVVAAIAGYLFGSAGTKDEEKPTQKP